jgi:hypothetical protein
LILAGHPGPKKSNIQISKYANVYNSKIFMVFLEISVIVTTI